MILPRKLTWVLNGVLLAMVVSSTPLVFAAQDVVLQEGESVNVLCPAQLTPLLRGRALTCARTCSITVTRMTENTCDQGGCFDVSYYDVELFDHNKTRRSQRAVYSDLNDAIDILKIEFKGVCQVYRVIEH